MGEGAREEGRNSGRGGRICGGGRGRKGIMGRSRLGSESCMNNVSLIGLC